MVLAMYKQPTFSPGKLSGEAAAFDRETSGELTYKLLFHSLDKNMQEHYYHGPFVTKDVIKRWQFCSFSSSSFSSDLLDQLEQSR